MIQRRVAWLAAPVLALALLLSWPGPSPAQKVFEAPELPDLADFIAEEARELGAAIDRREELQAERRSRIADLERKLGACGGCAQRGAIQGELEHWRATDRAVADAERAALAAVGLGRFGSVDEMKAGLAAGLAQWSAELEAQSQRRADMDRAQTAINLHCQAQAMRDVPAQCAGRLSASSKGVLRERTKACARGFQAGVVYTNDLTVRELCRKARDPRACVRDNSVLARMGDEGRRELITRAREQRAAGVDPRPLRDRPPTREELAQRRAEERERNERVQAAATPQERQRIRAEHANRERERLAARKVERADERRQQQGCELS